MYQFGNKYLSDFNDISISHFFRFDRYNAHHNLKENVFGKFPEILDEKDVGKYQAT